MARKPLEIAAKFSSSACSQSRKGTIPLDGVFRRQYDCHILRSPEFNPFRKLRLDHLRSRLVSLRMEKHALASEIQSPVTGTGRKRQATQRQTAITIELQRVATELEEFIASARKAPKSR
jgi:hypothetical protein